MKHVKKIRILGKKKLKIQARHFSRAYYTSVVFPEIRLCGKWLTHAGFTAGEFVTIHYQKNKIIITQL
ncbi:SymE family type I addiction module toxin [Lacibacter sp. H375]|uniref:SymE family type I addiction module toxin n=1 Tax=Lacibacter sp. H375 TaxID=3133424 RepID=UPI0030BAED85